MCFVDLEKAYNRVPWGVCGRHSGNVGYVFMSCVCILGIRLNVLPEGVGLCQGRPLSPILFLGFTDRISRHSQGQECVRVGSLRITSLFFFTDDVVLLASSLDDLQQTTERFTAKCEVAGTKIRASKNEAVVFCRKTVGCSLWVGGSCCPKPGSSSVSWCCSRVMGRWRRRWIGILWWCLW